MAEYKVVDAEQLDSNLVAIADEVRILTDTSSTMHIEEIPTNIAQANANVDTQSDIIAQIKTALVGKAGSSASEIEAKIDESGVLDGTEQSLDEKVDGLIDRAEAESIWYEASKHWKSNFSGLFMDYTNMKKLPRLSFENATNATSMLDGSGLETVDIYLDTAKVTNFYQMFHKSTRLKSIVGLNTSNGTNLYGCFAHCYALETIEEPLDLSKATSVIAMFNRCDALANVLFVSGSIGLSIQIPSAKLTDKSIQSIIDGLADLTGKTAQTLTLSATVKAKLTEEQLATITGKNWSVA